MPGKRLVSPLFVAFVVAAVLAILPSGTALAHPLGNFTVNRYAEVVVHPADISMEYIVDMAEIPTYQEITQTIDKNHDGVTDESETTAYRTTRCGEIPHNLSLSSNGKPLTLALVLSAVEFPPGAGGLLTLRLTCDYHTDLNAGSPNTILFRDGNYADRIGWREIVVRGDGAEIQYSTALNASISDKLRSYPNDLINNPPHQTEAHFTATGIATRSSANAPALGSNDVLDRTKDAFAGLITASDLTWQVVLLSLLLATVLGALHAVSPGHGKTIMAAYLVGARGTVAQALVLGLTVTVTHTMGVLALGIITLFASRYILPESLYPWLSLASGVLAIGMGMALAYSRWRILHPEHDHDSHDHLQVNGASHRHRHEEDESLIHGHSHVPVSFARDGLTWRSLFALGLAGGLVPSTSALILLLSAISLQRITFGIILIVAFGLGMAMVLVGVGVMLVRASNFLERRHAPARMMRLMPMLSALVVIGAGIVVSAGALLQMGVWKP